MAQETVGRVGQSGVLLLLCKPQNTLCMCTDSKHQEMRLEMVTLSINRLMCYFKEVLA